jgi:hypothetical protein
MSSFHRSDWLSLIQTVASIGAVASAFLVVFWQNCLESRRQERADVQQRLRERYRASTYVEAVVGNALDAAAEVVNGVSQWDTSSIIIGDRRLETDRLDECSMALAQALHQSLPTELTKPVHAAWAASQLIARAAHRTSRAERMKTTQLLDYCRSQHAAIQQAQNSVVASREKWEADLASFGSAVDTFRSERRR